MDFSPNALLLAKGIETQSPLELAGKGASLGDLMTGLQIKQFALQQQQQMAQMYQDPSFAPFLEQMVNGGQGGQPIDTSVMQKYPLGIQAALPNLLTMQKNSADIGKLRADTAKAQSETRDQANARAANALAAVQQSPSQQTVASAFNLMKEAGIDPAIGGPMPQSVDDAVKWATQAYSALTPAATRATTAQTTQATEQKGIQFPFDIAKLAQDLQLEPQRVHAALINAYAHSTEAQTGVKRQAYGEGSITIDPVTRQPIWNAPPNITGGAPVAVTGGGGQPTTLSAQEATTGNFKELTAPETLKKIANANELQQAVMRMRDKDAQGIYSGPIGSSEWWKDITSLMAPFMSPEDRATVANSQAYNQIATGVLAKYTAEQFPRANPLGFRMLAPSKPSDSMIAEGRQMAMNNVYNEAERTKQYYKGAVDFAAKNIGHPLSEYQPQYGADVEIPPTPGVQLKPKAGTTFQNLPPAKSMGPTTLTVNHDTKLPNGTEAKAGQRISNTSGDWVIAP
jgi:hypothetical protein